MPWTQRPDMTLADALAFEEMLDQLAQADRQARLREAYAFPIYALPMEPMSLPAPREDHHD